MRKQLLSPRSFVRTIIVLISSVVTISAAPGDLDPTFGIDGLAVDYIGKQTVVNKVLIQADGKIVVIGTLKIALQYQGPLEDRLFIRRYTSTGVLDATYPMPLGIGVDAELQADGKLVVLGQAPHSFLSRPYGTVETISPIVWRFTVAGNTDTSFGNSGQKFVNTMAPSDLHVETFNNNTVIAYSSKPPGLEPKTYKIAKLSSSGIISFTVVLPFAYSSEKAFSMKVDAATGDILTVGTKPSTYDGVLRRYNTNGTLVTSFGSNGEVSVYDCISAELKPTDLIIQPDGRILVARGGGSYGSFCVTRAMPNGSLDPAFTPILREGATFGPNLFLQPDGKMYFHADPGQSNSTIRYNPDGILDITSINPWTFHPHAIQPDQKTVQAYMYPSGTLNLQRRLLD